MMVKSSHLKINIKESEFVLKNDISKVKVDMKVPKLESEKRNFKLDSRQFLKSNGIKDYFGISYRNMDLYKKLGIKVPISYADIPAEMVDYKKNYDKFIRIVNEYIHNIEQSKREKLDENVFS